MTNDRAIHFGKCFGLIILPALCLFATACQTASHAGLVIGEGEAVSLQPPTYEEYVDKGGLHIVATDFNGDYLDHFREERVADFGRYVSERPHLTGPEPSEAELNRAAMDVQLKLLREQFQPGKHTRIVLFIHGGLNREKVAREGAFAKLEEMRRHSPEVFPIFLTWNSGLWSSYGHNLLFEDGGISYRRAQNSWLHVAFSPLRLAGDIMVGVSRAPQNLVNNSGKVAETIHPLYQQMPRSFPSRRTFLWQYAGTPGLRTLDNKTVDRSQESTIGEALRMGGFAASPGSDAASWSLGSAPRTTNWAQVTSNVAYSPVKTATAIGHDWFGTQSWHNMIRRTRTLVRPFEQFIYYNKRPKGVPEEAAFPSIKGVASLLIESLQCYPDGVEVELYGHSMGAMVSNEILREINTGRLHDPEFSRIAYLAAACSMRDFIDTGGRYLEDKSKDRFVEAENGLYRRIPRKDCEFFSLSLHPLSEVKETISDKINPLVSGSLLIWIDNIFQTPEAILDRTLGDFSNAVIARDYLPKGPNVTYKAFGYSFGNDRYRYGPQKHGELDSFQFWDKRYLSIRATAEDQDGGYTDLHMGD